jgi:hypothetical protein
VFPRLGRWPVATHGRRAILGTHKLIVVSPQGDRLTYWCSSGWRRRRASRINPHIIHIHAGRESIVINSKPGPVPAYCHVQQDEKVVVKLTRPVNAIRNISDMVLHAVNKPADRGCIPLDRVSVKSGDTGVGRASVIGVLIVVVLPVHGPNHRAPGVYVFHDIDLSTRGPADRSNIISKHPERGPHPLKRRHGNACFNPPVPPRLSPLRFHTRGSILHATERLPPRCDHQLSIRRGCILSSVILQFIVTPAAGAGSCFKYPVGPDAIRELIGPNQLPLRIGIRTCQHTRREKNQA